MEAPTLPTCGACWMTVCEVHKRILEQCDCTSARKRRTDVACPGGCWR